MLGARHSSGASSHLHADGARFEIAFEKARQLKGGAVEPVLAQLRTDDNRAHWQWTTGDKLDRGVSLATAYRLRDAARRRGLLPTLALTETDRRPTDATPNPDGRARAD